VLLLLLLLRACVLLLLLRACVLRACVLRACCCVRRAGADPWPGGRAIRAHVALSTSGAAP